MTASTRHIAVIGAGMAAITCARTLVQAGHQVTVFEKSRGLGGRMATRSSPFGTFDHGAQYFTVRDARFVPGLQTCRPSCASPGAPTPCRCSTRVAAWLQRPAALAKPHWVAVPGMTH
jgi:renalase